MTEPTFVYFFLFFVTYFYGTGQVAKLQHYAYTKSIELIADSFKEIDLQDGARRREFERYQSPSRTRWPTQARATAS